VKLHPFQTRLAEIWRKFGKEGGKGLELNVHLMGPGDWRNLCECLKANAKLADKIAWLEMQADAAELLGDKEKSMEYRAMRAYQILNLNKC